MGDAGLLVKLVDVSLHRDIVADEKVPFRLINAQLSIDRANPPELHLAGI